MKKIILLALILSAASIKAQTTLTNSILPVLGDSISVAMDTVLKSEGNSGANITWNFSGLKTVYKFKRYNVMPSFTPYSSLFPSASLARTDYNGIVYTYWKNSSTASMYYGFVQPAVVDQTFKTPITYYKFPINYNDNFTDTFTAVTNPGAITGKGKYSFKADAWGSLTLPNKTVTNTLRTKSIIYIGDSSINSYSLTTEYAWYQNGHKEPLLLISRVIVNKVLTRKFVMFDFSNTSGIEDLSAVNTVKLFPNPATKSLSVSIDRTQFNGGVYIRVFDMLGKKVFESPSEIFTNAYNLELSTFNCGTYLLEISTKNRVVHYKFMKE
ncbi:MAG: T9SS type A sorting domain-containing protein [Bacteroidia bacterium]